MPINVIVANDHHLLRKGLVALLKNHKEIDVTGEVSSCDGILSLSENNKCDVLLLDLSMLNNRFEILEKVRKSVPDLKCLVISSLEDDNLIGYAIEKGAAGYIEKNADAQEMVLAIHSVANSGFYINEKTSSIICKRLALRKISVPARQVINVSFSEKELKIIELLRQELSNAEIGKQIFLSHRTVETIRQQMIKKAGVRNALGLVLFAARNGFIQI